MAKIYVDPKSWLNRTNLLELNGALFWDQADFPEIPVTTDDFFIQLTSLQSQRPDLIAFDYYGTAELEWVILLANNIDYPNQLVEGQTIRLPAMASIQNLLTSQGDQTKY